MHLFTCTVQHFHNQFAVISDPGHREFLWRVCCHQDYHGKGSRLCPPYFSWWVCLIGNSTSFPCNQTESFIDCLKLRNMIGDFFFVLISCWLSEWLDGEPEFVLPCQPWYGVLDRSHSIVLIGFYFKKQNRLDYFKLLSEFIFPW